jgi:parallel beta-helix repeat protein
MKHSKAIRGLASLILALTLSTASSYAQGPLTPPGSPAPTMKTLEQIEPRTPITNLPVTISIPGSYYLTTTLTGTVFQSGITIESDDVTLDLGGFTLYGGGTNSHAGITVSGNHHNITIRNGVVRDWGRHGVDGFLARNSSLENLKVYFNGWGGGLWSGLRIGRNSRVIGCQAQANERGGIHTDTGCSVRDSSSRENGGVGIFAGFGSTISGTSSTANGGDGIHAEAGSTISGTSSIDNGDDGFQIGSGTTIGGSSAYNNDDDGINASSDCTITGLRSNWNGGRGINGGSSCAVTDSSAFGNGEDGIRVSPGSTITGSSAYANGTNGIVAGVGSTVTGNSASFNQGKGIEVDDNCTVSGNTAGYNVVNGIEGGEGSLVLDCAASENGGVGIAVASNSTIKNCTANHNDLDGIATGQGSLIRSCTANKNGKKTDNPANANGDGLEVTLRCRIIDCQLFDNAGVGLNATDPGNRHYIEGCQVYHNDSGGILLQGSTGNTVIRNHVAANTGFNIGPVGTADPGTGGIAPIQSGSTQTHPAANYQ